MSVSPDARRVFVARTHSRSLAVDASCRATGSRVGGAPPGPIGDRAQRCGRCGAPLLYVLTLEADALGDDVARGRAASLLACGGACLAEGPLLGEGQASVVLVHEPSPRGPSVEWQWAPRGRGLTAGRAGAGPRAGAGEAR